MQSCLLKHVGMHCRNGEHEVAADHDENRDAKEDEVAIIPEIHCDQNISNNVGAS